jgi:hypothetical protein
MEEWKEIQCAHQLLSMMAAQKTELVSFFDDMYRRTFSTVRVPVVRQGNGVVLVNRLKAIEFLKKKYNFVSREERNEILTNVSEEFQERVY